MLNVHSSKDLSTRARIRNAAVERFAREGFAAPVRLIAADAGVSAALVIHHFGSKESLRGECDDFMLGEIRRAKQASVDQLAAGGGLIEILSQPEESATMLGYVLRSLQDGGRVGKTFIDNMIEDAIDYTRDAVEKGLAHPSVDEQARARYLMYSGLGALLLEVTFNPPADPEDLGTLVREFLETSYKPMLELYSQGFFTTRRLLDEYLVHISDPPEPRGPADTRRPGRRRRTKS